MHNVLVRRAEIITPFNEFIFASDAVDVLTSGCYDTVRVILSPHFADYDELIGLKDLSGHSDIEEFDLDGPAEMDIAHIVSDSDGYLHVEPYWPVPDKSALPPNMSMVDSGALVNVGKLKDPNKAVFAVNGAALLNFHEKCVIDYWVDTKKDDIYDCFLDEGKII